MTAENRNAETPDLQFGYRWRWRSRLPERFGQPCEVTARGRLNTVRVDFPDGHFVFTSRWAVRRS